MIVPLKIAVAGLGTVGAGTVKLLLAHAEILAARCARPLQVTAVSAQNRSRDRGFDLGQFQWFDDPIEMARSADADLIVEVIGGSDGVAKALCEAALDAGRHVVTANKALLAEHGTALARRAEANGAAIGYEAAVAGGIPIIKAMREGLAGNAIDSVYGILNGTSNFILTEMRETGRAFDDVLADAQAKGYAEADPSFDIDGVDAAHKLALLTSLAFGTEVDFPSVMTEGIRRIAPLDIAYATELGYRIKLLAIARRGEGGIEQRVHPAMVPLDAPIAAVEGVFNAVMVTGDAVGQSVYEGRGAGEGPTASAVVADIVDIARGNIRPTFGVPADNLAAAMPASMSRHIGSYYVRLVVRDQPGVIADISAALRDEQVSLESVLQRGRAPGEAVPVVLTTHETEEAAMLRVLDRIAAMQTVEEPPCMIRIESF